MPVDTLTRLRPGQVASVYLDDLYGRHVGVDEYQQLSLSLHSGPRQPYIAAPAKPRSAEMSLSPPAATGPSPSGSRIGRPPQWTVSRSRKLARLYLYSTLSIERIIKVLEDDGFKPRCAFEWQPCPPKTEELTGHQEELGPKDDP